MKKELLRTISPGLVVALILLMPLLYGSSIGPAGGGDADTLDGQTAAELTPPGAMMPYGGSSDPTGWFLCDGRAVSRTTYSTLFGVTGTTYGVGDGSTTFNIPDFRGRAPIGPDDMGTAQGNAGRVGSNDALGQSSGADTHTLTEAQMPAHTHSTGQSLLGGGTTAFLAGGNGIVQITGSTGGGNAHNNMQPYQVANYIIKQ